MKTIIFQEGVDKGLWQDTEEWKRKVDNQINTNYKGNCVLSDTKVFTPRLPMRVGNH